MDWNPHVLGHPALDSTDKLAFHLLEHLGGDRPQARQQLATWLALSPQHLEQVCARLQQQGLLKATEGARPSQPPRPPEPDLQVSLSYARPGTPDHTTAAALAPGRRPSSRPAPKGEPVELFPIALGHYWPAIAPGCPLPAEPVLLSLEAEYGRHLCLAVARHLLLTRRKLPDLEQPEKAWHAFVRACQEEAQHPSYSDPPPAVAPARPSWSAVAGPGALRADALAEEKAA